MIVTVASTFSLLCSTAFFAGAFDPVQIASRSIDIEIPWYVPEGLAYDPTYDQILITSMTTGYIRAFPNSDKVSAGASENTVLYDGSTGTGDSQLATPLAGIKVYNQIAYAAVGMIPVLKGPFFGGVILQPIGTPNAGETLYDLSNLVNVSTTEGNAEGMFCNDIALSSADGSIYVTDLWGYRLFRIPPTGPSTVVLAGPPLMCTECNAALNTFDGPNGIESKDDFLLMGRGGDNPALIRIPVANPSSAVEISILPDADVLIGLDGIVFDSKKEILYVVAGSLNQVVALRSVWQGNWTSAEVVAIYSTNCTAFSPSAVSIVTATGDMLILCPQGFMSGPYYVNRLVGVANDYSAADNSFFSVTNNLMVGEGIAWQSQTDHLFFGSLSKGNIYSTPIPNGVQKGVSYTTARGDVALRVDNPSDKTTVGIRFDPNDPTGDTLWAAYRPSKGFEVSGAIRMSIKNGNVTLDCNVFNTVTKLPIQENDIAISTSSGDVFFTATDTFQIYRISSSTFDNFNAPGVVFADEICGNCTKGSDNGPNGIAIYPGASINDEILISSVYGRSNVTGFLYSISTADGLKRKLSMSDLGYTRQIDGLTFDSKNEFLFGMSHDYNAIIALYSCDGWKTEARIAQMFSGGCKTSDTTTAAYTSSGDLLIYCASMFQTGPYTVARISSIRSRILGSTYSSVAELCSGSPNPPAPAPDAASSDSNNGLTTDQTAVVILAVFLFVALLLLLFSCLMWFRIRDKVFRKDNFNSSEIESPFRVSTKA